MNVNEQRRISQMIGNRRVFEMTPQEYQMPITKEVGKMCKHRLERRWYRRLVELNIVIILFTIILFFSSFDEMGQYFNDLSSQMTLSFEESEDGDVIEDGSDTGEESDSEDGSGSEDESDSEDSSDLDELEMPLGLDLMLTGIFTCIAFVIGLYAYFAVYKTNSVRITERNFPEVYYTIDFYSKKLGIKTPKAYIMQQNGVLNAFSTFLIRKQWIMINAEVFEVAYREHQDKQALNFIIAHELAHIYYKHSTFFYNLCILFSKAIPIVGTNASRAREYSCDRLAQRLTGSDGLDSMLMLTIDRHLYKMVDKNDYLYEMSQQRGFFVWLMNLLSTHPIMSKRVIALVEGRGSGKLY